MKSFVFQNKPTSVKTGKVVIELNTLGELPYEEYTGVCHELGKISEKSISIFHKNSGKGYNIWKKFQIGSVILMAQMTKQKKAQLIDYFGLVWTKNAQIWKIWEMEAIFSQNSPQNRISGDLN